jgi:hypothetical protein
MVEHISGSVGGKKTYSSIRFWLFIFMISRLDAELNLSSVFSGQ